MVAIDLSDHLPILISIPDIFVTHTMKQKKEVRKVTVKKVEYINKELDNIDWYTELGVTCTNITDCTVKCNNDKDNMASNNGYSTVPTDLTSNNGTEMFTKFHDIVLDTINKHAPKKLVDKKLRSKCNPWLSKGLLNSSNRIRGLFEKTLSPNCPPETRLKYKESRNLLNRLKRRSKLLFYQNKCIEFRNNSKRLWQIINELSGKIRNKSTVINWIKINDIKTYSSKKITNEFGKYFSEIGEKFANKKKNSKNTSTNYLNKNKLHDKTLFRTPTDIPEICTIINKLPNKHSSGNDENIRLCKNYTKVTRGVVISCNVMSCHK